MHRPRLKYIDDMSLCQAIDLSKLQTIDWEMEGPLNYRDRTHHYLPTNTNKLQLQMNEVQKFCEIQKFKINENKTQTVVFNVRTSRDFYPRIQNSMGKIYNNVENFKLLGVDISTDKRNGMNFDTYINECIKKGYQKLWILRRLAESGGVSVEYLLLSYFSRVRVCVEFNVPLWMFSLTKVQKDKIERLQKIALYIILGKNADKHYSVNLAKLNCDTLEDRRQKIAENFAKKTLKHPEHRKIFNFDVSKKTRSGKKVVIPKFTTERYRNSPIPSLGNIINLKFSHKI